MHRDRFRRQRRIEHQRGWPLRPLAHFVDEGLVEGPLFIQSIFGILGGLGADPENLVTMKSTADRLFGRSSVRSCVRDRWNLAVPLHGWGKNGVSKRLVCDIGSLPVRGGVRAKGAFGYYSLDRPLHLRYQSLERDRLDRRSRTMRRPACRSGLLRVLGHQIDVQSRWNVGRRLLRVGGQT